jgi:hypothetical protein
VRFNAICLKAFMKTIALTTLSLIFCNAVFATPPQVEIKARYEGCVPYYDSLGNLNLTKGHKPDNLLSTPKVTTTSGQQVSIKLVREVRVQETPSGEKSVDCGITLEVLPVAMKNGRISLSGKNLLRRPLVQDSSQSLGSVSYATSFATQETFFFGVVPDGNELIIAVNDDLGPKARIFLTARLVAPSAVEAK